MLRIEHSLQMMTSIITS